MFIFFDLINLTILYTPIFEKFSETCLPRSRRQGEKNKRYYYND